jgi:hypothetical protein
MVRVLQRSPVREIRTPGSARGLSGNRQFYLNNEKPAAQILRMELLSDGKIAVP